MRALHLATTWPVEHAHLAVVTPDDVIATFATRRGQPAAADDGRTYRLASLTKCFTAWALLIAVEEGVVELDRPLDPSTDRVPEGVTLRHLLAHASGFGFEGDEPVARPERNRIYSNPGIERAADVLARAADMPFADYLAQAVLQPLGLTGTELRGSPAHGLVSTVDDVARFLVETMSPRLIASATRDEAVRPQYPTLTGIVPGVGRFNPCPWGLGFELHGGKAPHWMGLRNSANAYGHFGGAGTMMWVDPDAPSGPIGLIALTDRPFDEWSGEALRHWPELSDAVLAEAPGG